MESLQVVRVDGVVVRAGEGLIADEEFGKVVGGCTWDRELHSVGSPLPNHSPVYPSTWA